MMVRFLVRPILAPALTAVALSACGGDHRPTPGDDVAGDTISWLPPGPDHPAAFDDSLTVSDGGLPPAGEKMLPPGVRCDPNYDPCVPVDSDVDCAGGRGDGPSYVAGPVRVIGSDPYGLDRDHDGVGCDN